ncbi:MAG: diguanylate cyclase, partial [Frankia sp.]|nr:diguanylate cyclase [Frankia sp.]
MLILLLALIAVLVGRFELERAQHRRLGERIQLVESIAHYRSETDDPALLARMAADAGFAPDDPAGAAAALAMFDLTPSGEQTTVTALQDRSGRPVVVRQHAGATGGPGSTGPPTTAQLGDAWQAALRGTPAVSNAFTLGGRTVRATLAPVGQDTSGGPAAPRGEPWAVLVTVSADEIGNEFKESLGSVGAGTRGGGLVQVDRTGVAVSSWDPAEVGTRVIDPARLRDLAAGEAVSWHERGGVGQDWTVVAAGQRSTGYTTVFMAPTDALYGDLRDQQSTRDRGIAATVATSGAGLLLFGVLRERGVRRARAQLGGLLANTHDLIVLVRDDRVAYLTPSAGRLLGQDQADWAGRPFLDLVHPDDRDRVRRLLSPRDPGRQRELAPNVRLRVRLAPQADGDGPAGAVDGVGDLLDHGRQAGGRAARAVADGERTASTGTGADRRQPGQPTRHGYRWFDLAAADARDEADLAGILVTCHEVGERKALQDLLSHQARHDPLTGLPNRAAFLSHVAGRLTIAAAGGTGDALLFCDLDGFKAVNDRYGHEAGDEVLRVVASRAGEALRPDDLLSRLGGDEFGVLVHNADDAAARATAQRLAAAIARPIHLPGPGGGAWVTVGASIGIALTAPDAAGQGGITGRGLGRPADGAVGEPAAGGRASAACGGAYALLHAADQAMYAAKRGGGAQRVVVAPAIGPPPRLPALRRPPAAATTEPGALTAPRPPEPSPA